MSFKVLRPQIVDLLNNNTKLQEVYSYPRLEFGGYPAGYVVPSDNSADYETNTENVRTYAFFIRMFYETKTGGVEQAFQALEELVDEVIDTFDEDDQKGSSTRTVGVSLPAGYTFLNILAHPSRWGELPDQELVMAEINVRVRVSIDVS